MLYPSIDNLLAKVPSKYSLIILAGKRSKDMQVNHDMQLEKYQSVKTVGKALEEVIADQLYIQED
ncbi:DNA-directed RNA polymerase subunit omega [Aerococcaceae bacterium NML191292]|nr:DNA-directed RNA polymerase subunit omega [Aerococcaceae bacterium NML210727]MCW6654654.1 DNA-directed RNA polymerase subunit omega [Aerococcaceae bacterium NML201296]MCW6658900.1 DNA-directed RNA polymerase subunit omega [Aerococcaceae bacterium NML191292]MCW6660664.1 DNA-directed RNA polymerase subunit omega [Aerococcaceae bacterium NML201209]MCW6663366.1 DNA-directed RNA polymerase subunit omega [Aerococcaceae bacterium NML190073]MCW6664683.1 DNA-directed RNA polymerase subunit omega [Ae